MSKGKIVVVDPAIFEEFMNQPEVKESASKLSPSELEWFKELVVSEGLYEQYVKERENRG